MANTARTVTARTLPIWASLETFNRSAFDAAPHDGSADVLVLGAGVAGLATAHALLRQGRRVTIVDRGGVGAGESLRTTAHLASALDDRYYQLARWHGADGARLAASSHTAAIDWIETFVAAAGGCGFKRVPAYLVSHDGNDERLRREHRAAADAGLDVEFLEAGAPGLPALGAALAFGGQARIRMDDYMLALARGARELGASFHTGDAVSIEGGTTPRAQLRDGAWIEAAAIVVATNVPFHESVAIHTKQAAYRSYVVAAPVPAGSVPDALIWDDGDPYHYVRLVEQDGATMLVVGGEDHKTGARDDPTAYVRLQAWTRERFPSVGTFTHGWSGQIIEPGDGLAFIGADPGGMRNVFIATGDSGNGVTHGTLAGLLLGELVMGRDHPWQALYDPQRKMLRAGGTWLHENADVARRYAEWLEPGDLPEADALAAGEGAVIRRGMHRVAVYRCGSGELVAFSARCPHLGCSVHWSSEEKSWDCPCHGSRFDGQTGAVLNGPAAAPLSPFEARPGDEGEHPR